MHKGHSISRYIESHEMSTFLDAVTESIKGDKLVSFSITLLNEKYDVSMIRFDDRILMMSNITESSRTVLEEISALVNEQVNESRKLSKKMISEKSALDEMAFLNNKLANMQREIAKKNLQLSRLTLTDTLTGACNRRSFFTDLRQFNEDVKVCMMDIDNFKTINDEYGHNKGDEVLKYFVEEGNNILNQYSEKGLYRLGGDEFAMIIAPSKQDSLTEDIKKFSNSLFNEFGHITISFGFSLIPKDYARTELDSLISVADKEMYESKNRKKSSR